MHLFCLELRPAEAVDRNVTLDGSLGRGISGSGSSRSMSGSNIRPTAGEHSYLGGGVGGVSVGGLPRLPRRVSATTAAVGAADYDGDAWASSSGMLMEVAAGLNTAGAAAAAAGEGRGRVEREVGGGGGAGAEGGLGAGGRGGGDGEGGGDLAQGIYLAQTLSSAFAVMPASGVSAFLLESLRKEEDLERRRNQGFSQMRDGASTRDFSHRGGNLDGTQDYRSGVPDGGGLGDGGSGGGNGGRGDGLVGEDMDVGEAERQQPGQRAAHVVADACREIVLACLLGGVDGARGEGGGGRGGR